MKSFSRKSVLGVLAVGAIGVAAACGGDDNGDSGPTVDEYIAQADAICARFDPQFEALEQPMTPGEVKPFLEETLALGREQTAELEALEVPEEIADLEAQARENNEEAVATFEEAIRRIDDGDEVREVVEDVSAESERIEESNDAIAAEIGLQVCGADDGEREPSTTTDEPEDTTTEAPPDDMLGSPDDSDSATTPSDPSPDDPSSNTAGQYLRDVATAAGSLNEIGSVFSAVDDGDALQARADDVREAVTEFRNAINSMETYSLDDTMLEEQRQGFVSAGQGLFDPLERLAAAAADGDVEAVEAVTPDLQAAVEEFQRASGSTP